MTLSDRERQVLAQIESELKLRPPARWWRVCAVARRHRRLAGAVAVVTLLVLAGVLGPLAPAGLAVLCVPFGTRPVATRVSRRPDDAACR